MIYCVHTRDLSRVHVTVCTIYSIINSYFGVLTCPLLLFQNVLKYQVWHVDVYKLKGISNAHDISEN